MRRWVILGLLAAMLAGGALAINQGYLDHVLLWAVHQVDTPVSSDASPVLFSVSPEESTEDIGGRLEAAGLVHNAILFRALVAYYDVEGALVAGDYDLRRNMTTTDIIQQFHRGLVRPVRVTVIEGLRREEVARQLDAEDVCPAAAFVEAAQRSSYAHDFLDQLPEEATLEGYLFPDTYLISPSTGAADFVELMLDNFGRRFTPEMRARAAEQGLTLHQVLTLASIVEREAVVPQERPIIAAVYLNRLAIDKPLEACPTVQYALAKDDGNVARFGYWKQELTNDDLDVSSPYNTYRRSGLPPGPIASPGLASIEAVLLPSDVDYLYFVARGDGSHAFAITFEEHQRNVAHYQR